MSHEVINILTIFGTSEDVEEAVRSFNIDMGDGDTLLAPNKLRFYSDRVCPYVKLSNISKTFPDVMIRVQFAHEDLGHNVGEFFLNDGVKSKAINPEGGSDEAYEMAITITGDDFFITDFLYGLDEDEIVEEFPELCIRLAFKFRVVNPIFPTYILRVFEKMAVDVEDYEFASEVREAINLQKVDK